MLAKLIISMTSLPPSPASSYRGRLAPSPTGYLHVGHARTFWAAYARSRDAGGTLVMRMEDLDPDRSRADYWQEGPEEGGPCTPYAQSQRRAIYLAAWRKLLEGGYLFPCRCSRKDLEAALSAPHEIVSSSAIEAHNSGELEPLDDEPIYPATCRTNEIVASSIAEPGNFNWRFRVPDGEVVEFVDENLGPQRFIAGRDFGDFVVWRRDGVPSYQLACVADDAAMRITEVVRGEDLLKSTARQILLYRSLELDLPAWFHCRLVTDSNGHRLAKRHDALSLRTLRQQGFTPEQILSGELPAEM
jgi:glutamyl-tRNA synthetase